MSALKFQWPVILQAIDIQYTKNFTEEDVLNMNRQTKSTYLCSNPVTAARMSKYEDEILLLNMV